MQTAPVTPETPTVTAKKHGGSRPGAGRKRSGLTPFGKWVDENELTSKKVAEKLGLSQSMAAQLITGRRRPSLEMMAKIKELTGGSVDFEDWLKVPEGTDE